MYMSLIVCHRYNMYVIVWPVVLKLYKKLKKYAYISKSSVLPIENF